MTQMEIQQNITKSSLGCRLKKRHFLSHFSVTNTSLSELKNCIRIFFYWFVLAGSRVTKELRVRRWSRLGSAASCVTGRCDSEPALQPLGICAAGSSEEQGSRGLTTVLGTGSPHNYSSHKSAGVAKNNSTDHIIQSSPASLLTFSSSNWNWLTQRNHFYKNIKETHWPYWKIHSIKAQEKMEEKHQNPKERDQEISCVCLGGSRTISSSGARIYLVLHITQKEPQAAPLWSILNIYF